jgi:hypothetical protein
MERISLTHLFEDQVQAPSSPVYWILGTTFLALLVGSFYVYLQSPWRYRDQPTPRRLASLYAVLLGSFSGLGLASAAFALLTVPFLSKRIWLIVASTGLLCTACLGAINLWRNRKPELIT